MSVTVCVLVILISCNISPFTAGGLMTFDGIYHRIKTHLDSHVINFQILLADFYDNLLDGNGTLDNLETRLPDEMKTASEALHEKLANEGTEFEVCTEKYRQQGEKNVEDIQSNSRPCFKIAREKFEAFIDLVELQNAAATAQIMHFNDTVMNCVKQKDLHCLNVMNNAVKRGSLRAIYGMKSAIVKSATLDLTSRKKDFIQCFNSALGSAKLDLYDTFEDINDCIDVDEESNEL